MTQSRQKIIIFERILTHYRLRFFNYLCENYPVEIIFITGAHDEEQGFLTDYREAKFKIISVTPTKVLGFEFYKWPRQLFVKHTPIVCVLSFRAISNVRYLLLSRIRGCSFYWWGHSKTFNGSGARYKFQNAVNQFLMKLGNGMLAYTEEEKSRIEAYGLDSNKVFALGNTLDTENIWKIRNQLTEGELDRFKKDKKLDQTTVLGLVGRLYKDRRTDFALDAFLNISARRANLTMVVIGGGPEYEDLTKRYQPYSNIIFAGPIEDEVELAPWMSSIDIFLNPGIVGLNLVHAFLYSSPTVTIESSSHSPEISYLKNGVNGLVTKPDFASYVEGIERLIADKELAKTMGNNGFDYACEKLSIKIMAENFLKILNK